ncbi:type II toxin-antitoxin system mRNA interferase toxin, RelE/StbE family [Endozoicomonas euniceicola]
MTGDWNGYRSLRLNKQYRVIYTIEPQMVQVKVIKVTAHDYKKR